MYESEVAQIRRQIETEMEALQRGMYGLSQGTARHDFINRRMVRVDKYHTTLAHYVGENVAEEMVCELYNGTMK